MKMIYKLSLVKTKNKKKMPKIKKKILKMLKTKMMMMILIRMMTNCIKTTYKH